MTFKRNAVLAVAAFLVVSLLPRTVAAQQSSGPMTVQRIGNSAFVAPDFKFTDFDNQACGLVGAYGGYLVENTFFIGAGGYGLTDTSPRGLWYLGMVLGAYVNRDRPVGFGFKALIGGGEATTGYSYYQQPRRGGFPTPYVATAYYRAGIFVFEPEANVVLHLNQHMSLSGGVGYRFAGDPYYYGYGDGHTSGVTGSVSVQIGGGL